MNIMVVSDTHGSLEKAVEMYERLGQGIHIDLIIHCGDYRKDAIELGKLLNKDVVSVMGNCDGNTDGDVAFVDTPAGKIVVTHGHAENAKTGSLYGLKELAVKYDAACVCFGHTHVPVIEEDKGVTYVNPGSITKPKDGTQGSVAFIVAEKEINASLIYF